MNIFWLDNSPLHCAKMHCDKHVVKMIVEYAQLLSTAHRVLDGHESTLKYITSNGKERKKKVWTLNDPEMNNVLYAATHINHPSAKWVRHAAVNYIELFKLFISLLHEYSYRYDKEHSCTRLVKFLQILPVKIPINEFSPPWRAMPDEYKMSKEDPNYCVESYRAYYIGEKQHIAKWTKRDAPEWFKLK